MSLHCLGGTLVAGVEERLAVAHWMVVWAGLPPSRSGWLKWSAFGSGHHAPDGWARWWLATAMMRIAMACHVAHHVALAVADPAARHGPVAHIRAGPHTSGYAVSVVHASASGLLAMAWRELWGSNPLRRGEEPRVHPYTKLLLRTVQLWWPLCMMTGSSMDASCRVPDTQLLIFWSWLNGVGWRPL